MSGCRRRRRAQFAIIAGCILVNPRSDESATPPRIEPGASSAQYFTLNPRLEEGAADGRVDVPDEEGK